MNSEGFSQTIRDLPQVWSQLGRHRQIAIGGLAGAIVLALIVGVIYLQRPHEVPLYSGLNEQDAAAIVSRLRDMKVPYKLTNGGTTILVPDSSAPDLRLQLAGQGLPSGSGVGMVGMEVFDRTNLGITDFAQRLNYQRGLEGELTRTVRRLSAVEDARVHLVLPQERLFTSQQKEVTASVMIKQRPGARLTDQQVQSIKFLVSRSVEGLKPENVAVVDFNGNTLGKPETPEELRDRAALTRQEIQRQREQELERKIQGLLDQVLGSNRSVVRATVALDWDEVKRDVETFSPGNTQPQVRSQRDTRENFSGQGVDIVPPVGVPGTQANVPSYQAATAGQTSSYQRSDVTTNYEVSSEKQSVVRAPGDIRHLGIAVMVDQSVPAAQVDQIMQVVTAAAGVQAARGDQVSVVSLPFDDSLAAQLRQQQERQRNMELYELIGKITGIAMAVIGLAVLFFYLRNTTKPSEVPALPGAEPVALPGGAAALLPPAALRGQIEEAMQALMPSQLVPGISREEVEAELRRKLEAEYESKLAAEREALRQAEEARAQQLEVEQQQAEEETARAQQLAERERRQRIRDEVVQIATTRPELVADILSTWLEQYRSRSAAAA